MRDLFVDEESVKYAIDKVDHIEDCLVGRVPNKEIYILYLIKKWMGARCKTYLEIGSLNGASMSLVMSDPDTQTRFVAIDLCLTGKDHFGNKVSPAILQENIDHFNVYGREYKIIPGNSHNSDVQKSAKKKVGDAGVDFLFLDGDHSHNGVRQDFYDYIDLVNSGGVIVFDDYDFIKTVRSGVDSIVDEIGDQDFEVVGAFANPDFYSEYPIDMKISKKNMNSEFILIKR